MTMKHKLVLLLLGTIGLTLFFVGIALNVLITSFHGQQAEERFKSLFQSTAMELDESHRALHQQASALAMHEDIILTVNMLVNYASADNYQALIFDDEKRKIANELLEQVRASGTLQLAIYDQQGDLVAYAGNEEQLRVGHSTYRDGQRYFLQQDQHKRGEWRETPPPASLETQIPIAQPNPEAHHYSLCCGGFSIQAQAPIIRSYPDGKQQVIGYISARRFFTDSFLNTLQQRTGLGLAIQVNDQVTIGELPALNLSRRTGVSTLKPGLELNSANRYESPDYFLAFSRLPIEGATVLLVAGINKATVAASVRNTQGAVWPVLAITALVIIPLGIFFANRTLTEPLQKLSDGLLALKRGHYTSAIPARGRDELASLAETFNDMAATILEREEDLIDSEKRYRTLVENLPQRIFHKDVHGTYVSCNRRYAQDVGYSVSEMIGKTDYDFFPPPLADKYRADDRRIMQSGQIEELTERYIANDRDLIIQTVKTPLYDSEGMCIGILGIFWDITERRQAEEKLQQAAAVFDSTADGVIITDANKYIIAANNAFAKITGFGKDEVIGKKPEFRRSDRHTPAFYSQMWQQINTTGAWQGEIWNRRKSGETYPEWLTISSVNDDSGKLINYVAVFSDITAIKQQQEKLQHLAHFDPLTDLPNRMLIGDRLEQAIQRAHREKHKVAALFLDLDRFKNVNDTLGHPVGDRVLRQVAERFRELLRNYDSVARLGGDEFLVVIDAVSDLTAVERVAERLIALFENPFNIDKHELFLGMSIGISLYPDDGDNVSELIKNADAAMYRAKESGRNTFQFYTQELTDAALERLSLEADLRHVFERNQLSVHYQPIIALQHGQITGAEALLRWKHSERGYISPEHFIPLAEEIGLIMPIGSWVLNTACQQLAAWQQEGLAIDYISVNISAVQVQRSNIVETVRQAISDSGIAPASLMLEITESTLMEDPQRVSDTLTELRKLGVGIAVDDFGTGYSSLSYLKRFPITNLKIDKSFIMDLTTDANDRAITQSIIALGKGLELNLIAEGVESVEHHQYLIEQSCELAQGYFYSKPVDSLELARLLAKKQVWSVARVV